MKKVIHPQIKQEIQKQLALHFEDQIQILSPEQSLNMLEPFILQESLHHNLHQTILKNYPTSSYLEAYLNRLLMHNEPKYLFFVSSMTNILQQLFINFQLCQKIISFIQKSGKYSQVNILKTMSFSKYLIENAKKIQQKITKIVHQNKKAINLSLVKIFLFFLIGIEKRDSCYENSIHQQITKEEQDDSWTLMKIKFFLNIHFRYFEQDRYVKTVSWSKKYLCIEEQIHDLDFYKGTENKEYVKCKYFSNRLCHDLYKITSSLKQKSWDNLINILPQLQILLQCLDFPKFRKNLWEQFYLFEKIKNIISLIVHQTSEKTYNESWLQVIYQISRIVMTVSFDKSFLFIILDQMSKRLIYIHSKERKKIMKLLIKICYHIHPRQEKRQFRKCLSAIKKCIEDEKDLQKLIQIGMEAQNRNNLSYFYFIMEELKEIGQGTNNYVSKKIQQLQNYHKKLLNLEQIQEN